MREIGQRASRGEDLARKTAQQKGVKIAKIPQKLKNGFANKRKYAIMNEPNKLNDLMFHV